MHDGLILDRPDGAVIALKPPQFQGRRLGILDVVAHIDSEDFRHPLLEIEVMDATDLATLGLTGEHPISEARPLLPPS